MYYNGNISKTEVCKLVGFSLSGSVTLIEQSHRMLSAKNLRTSKLGIGVKKYWKKRYDGITA